ncbi:hypothetical protein BV25DRAFT_1995564 [Artomyces pyxidatus]|uniref:Uncharacterized protein n=1 Tax=Artomyces pyxidatus TaxID=48021 RepID=A0ACB8SJC1_9AGAM|nr:hypothetical protein BV25DRAFT_1995564 [Artomyces pyxidatus]
MNILRGNVEIARHYWAEVSLRRLSPYDRAYAQGAAGVRAALDAEELAVQSAIICVRSRRNALSPISRLPLEILTLVFEFFSHLRSPHGYFSSSDNDRSTTVYYPLGWIWLSHVCRRWREAAMNPRLWRFVPIELGPEWVREGLARCKSVPIIIRLGVLQDGHEAELKALMDTHLCQVQKIDFKGRSASLQVVSNALASSDALALEELSLEEIRKKSPRILLKPLHTPNLRRLSLQDVIYSWNSFPMCNLSHLEVCVDLFDPITPVIAPNNVAIPPSSQLPSPDEFFHCLSRNTSLETLIIKGCLPSRLSPSTGDHVARLPLLKKVVLAGPTLDVAHAVQRIVIPSSSKLHLTCYSNDESGEEVLSIIPAMNTHLKAHTPHPISLRTLSMEGSEDRKLKFVVWDYMDIAKDGTADFFPFEEEDHEVSLDFHWHNPTYLNPVPLLRKICAALPLSDIRAVGAFLSNSKWTAQDWVDMFGRCRAIEALEVQKADRRLFLCEALMEEWRPNDGTGAPVHASVDDGTKDLFLPALRALCLQDVDLQRRYPGRDSSGSFGDLILSCIRERQLRGSPLDMLSITTDGVVEPSLLQSFKEVVGIVRDLKHTLEDEEDDDSSHGSD